MSETTFKPVSKVDHPLTVDTKYTHDSFKHNIVDFKTFKQMRSAYQQHGITKELSVDEIYFISKLTASLRVAYIRLTDKLMETTTYLENKDRLKDIHNVAYQILTKYFNFSEWLFNMKDVRYFVNEEFQNLVYQISNDYNWEIKDDFDTITVATSELLTKEYWGTKAEEAIASVARHEKYSAPFSYGRQLDSITHLTDYQNEYYDEPEIEEELIEYLEKKLSVIGFINDFITELRSKIQNPQNEDKNPYHGTSLKLLEEIYANLCNDTEDTFLYQDAHIAGSTDFFFPFRLPLIIKYERRGILDDAKMAYIRFLKDDMVGMSEKIHELEEKLLPCKVEEFKGITVALEDVTVVFTLNTKYARVKRIEVKLNHPAYHEPVEILTVKFSLSESEKKGKIKYKYFSNHPWLKPAILQYADLNKLYWVLRGTKLNTAKFEKLFGKGNGHDKFIQRFNTFMRYIIPSTDLKPFLICNEESDYKIVLNSLYTFEIKP